MELMTPELQPQIQSLVLSGKHAVIGIIQQCKQIGGYFQLYTDAEMLRGVVHWVQEVYDGQALPLCCTTLNICPFPRLGSCPSHDWASLVVPFIGVIFWRSGPCFRLSPFIRWAQLHRRARWPLWGQLKTLKETWQHQRNSKQCSLSSVRKTGYWTFTHTQWGALGG